jgi:glycosyltransferase involved in cell wall biosynthesis
VSSPDDSDLSRLGRDLARQLESRTVVALGCPRPRRLAALASDVQLIVLDRADRIEQLRRELPGAECREWDPAAGDPLPVPADRLRGSIAVCDGVLETLDDPAHLLRGLSEALHEAACAILVTADRDLVRRGAPLRARFSTAELRDRLESEGLEVSWIGIGRSPQTRLERSSSMMVVGGTRAGDLPELLATGARNLRFDPGAVLPAERGAEPLRICIASYEFVGPTKTGGIGTAYTSLADALADAGHEVTVLYLGLRDPEESTPFSHWVDHYARRGIRFVELPEADLPRVYYGHFEAKRSYLAYMWLAAADRERRFDVIHFPETLGHGYYSLLAKHQGWAFARATIAVGVHSSTYWVMETNRVPFLTGQEFAADFLERASVALADVVISPSAYMVDWMESRGWELPERVFVQQYVRSRVVADGAERAGDPSGGIDEIVFFGRLETRKGIVLFCDALDRLAEEGAIPDVSIAFMGKQTVIEGRWAKEYLARRGREWPWRWRILDRFGQPEAVAYLRGNGVRRLAVMPSLADNTPNTVMEALALRIPFIASRVGGTAELIHPLDLGRSTFDPGGQAGDAELAAALRDAVEASDFRPPQPAVESDANERVHLRWHDGVAAASRGAADVEPGEAAPPAASARVSVCVLAGDRGRVREAIASIEAQEHPDVELVMILDGGGRQELEADLERAEETFVAHGWKLLRGESGGRPEVLNHGASNAAGTYLLFLAEGAVPEPSGISTLVRVAERTGADVVTAAAKWSADAGTGIRPPEGGPPVAGLFYRCFGDTGYLIRRDAFEALGGFDPDSEPGSEDHELLCRAALEGYRIEIVPEPLISERLGEGVTPGEAIHAKPGAVLRAYERRATNGLAQLPQVAQAQWALAGSKDAEIRGILESRSWRVTTPLRWVTGKLGRRPKAAPPPS